MNNNRLPRGLGALFAAGLLAAAMQPAAAAGTTREPFQREGTEDDGEIDIFSVLLGPGLQCNCPACQAERSATGTTSDAGARPAPADANGAAQAEAAPPLAKALDLLREAQTEIHRPNPGAGADSAARDFAWQAAAAGVDAAIKGVRAYQAAA